MISEHQRIQEELCSFLDQASHWPHLEELKRRVSQLKVEAMRPNVTINSHEQSLFRVACNAVMACLGPRKITEERRVDAARTHVYKLSMLEYFRALAKDYREPGTNGQDDTLHQR